MKTERPLSGPKRERGATMVEYGIMVALMAVALIATIIVMRDSVDTGFRHICQTIADVISDVDCGS